ncbi:MAG: hypothetical protein AAGA10_26225 [Bacteroidota bacterium]
MKANTTIFVYFFLFSSLTLLCQNGIVVEGMIKDAEEDFAILAYSSRLRGNLNFDKFRSVGSRVNERGEFKLTAPKITHAATYRLFFPEHYVRLNLFAGDSIYLEIYLEDSPNTFATGKGAGKVNVLNLPQFQYDYADLEKERGLKGFVNYVDSVVEYRLGLLEEIYSRNAEGILITKAENRDYLKRIIQYSPLSKEEFDFLKNIARFSRFTLIGIFFESKGSQTNLHFGGMDVSGSVFSDFNENLYSSLEDINELYLHGDLDWLLRLAYLREKEEEEGLTITFGNWRNVLQDSGYTEWCAEFLKQNFKEEVYYKYFAEDALGYMTWGHDIPELFTYLDFEQDNKYISRIKGFRKLLENGLNDPEYGLDDESKQLNESKFKALVGKYEGKSHLITFWSAQAAGTSVIDELPYLRAFEQESQDKLEMLYICVDKIENKKLWAARIIDESWVGEHYFLPREGNEAAIAPYSKKDISSLCNGGAAYSFVDKKGEIEKDTKGPFYMDQKEMERFFELYLN